MKKIEVVAAVIKYENKYLCCKRSPHGEVGNKWEFPGGKIESGETHEDALIREISEELCIELKVNSFLTTIKHEYNTFHLTLHAYMCEATSMDYKLIVHTDAKLLRISELQKLDWAAADLPIINMLQTNINLSE